MFTVSRAVNVPLFSETRSVHVYFGFSSCTRFDSDSACFMSWGFSSAFLSSSLGPRLFLASVAEAFLCMSFVVVCV